MIKIFVNITTHDRDVVGTYSDPILLWFEILECWGATNLPVAILLASPFGIPADSDLNHVDSEEEPADAEPGGRPGPEPGRPGPEPWRPGPMDGGG